MPNGATDAILGGARNSNYMGVANRARTQFYLAKMADVVLPHHKRQDVASNRPDYRAARWERAVKVGSYFTYSPPNSTKCDRGFDWDVFFFFLVLFSIVKGFHDKSGE